MTNPKLLRSWLWFGLATMVACSSSREPEVPLEMAASGERPNILVMLVDDMRWDEYGAAGHPFAETPNIDRLAREGATFTNAFHVCPLCSPNRASLLTGQYPSRHGIIDNVARNLASHGLETFPQALRASGYETGFLGKWHMGNDPTPRPGFDYWAAIPGQGRIIDPTLFEDGRAHRVEGYITDILTDRAIGFIDRDRDKPFFLFMGHKALHPDATQLNDGSVDMNHPMRYIPAERHAGRYAGRGFPRRRNAIGPLESIAATAVRRALERRASEEVASVFPDSFLDPGTSDESIQQRAEMLLAVDEGLGRILDVLDRRGILDQTVVAFLSDNGFFFGEHGLSIERRLPYDEAIRDPILMRYPPLIAPGSTEEGLAMSIDVAPTLLDLAGAPIGDHIQGRSLVPLLTGDPADWRSSVLIEFYTYENPMPWLTDMDYRAVRTQRYKYIHWIKHPPELYDLSEDPYELENLVDDPEMADIARELRDELGRLSNEAIGLHSGR